MPQFFIDQPFEVGGRTQIKGRDAHHIVDVLRLKAGDWLILSDGKGRSFRAEIISAKSKYVEVLVVEEIKRRHSFTSPTLAFAIIKHDRSEWIIQKAVEVGCKHLIPFVGHRTIPQYTRNLGIKKHARWQKIALEAAKQSGLPFVPRVDSPIKFDELCSKFGDYEKSILFWEGEQKMDIRSCISRLGSRVLLVIGPEGGFDEAEVDRAVAQGAVTVSLGQQILRVETAAIVALAIVQYELGNLSIIPRASPPD